MKKNEQVLNDISSDGRQLITPSEAGMAFGWVGQTSRNKLCEGKFPVRTVDFMGKKMVKVEDLAAFLDNLKYSDAPAKSKLGAPKKSVQIVNKKAREAAAAVKGGV